MRAKGSLCVSLGQTERRRFSIGRVYKPGEIDTQVASALRIEVIYSV